MSDEDKGRLKKLGKGLLKTSPAYLAAHAINEKAKERKDKDAAQPDESSEAVATEDSMALLDQPAMPDEDVSSEDGAKTAISIQVDDPVEKNGAIESSNPRIYPKVAKLIAPSLRSGEQPLFCIDGSFKQTIVCFEDRCIVAKPGFMAGNTFGGMVTSFDYREITGIQMQLKMSSGYLEILTSSFQSNKTKSYWSQGRDDDPDKLPNCIPLLRNAQRMQAAKIQRLRDLISQAKTPALQPPAAAAGGDDLASQLERLSALKASGVLSDEEFTQGKAKLLGI